MMESDIVKVETTYLPYYPISAVSCITFLGVFRYVSPVLSRMVCPVGYDKLTWGQKADWDLRVASTIHSLIVFTLATHTLLFDEIVQEDPIWGNSNFVRTTSSVVCGFMMADAIVIIVYWSAIGEIGYIFHHIAVLWAYYYVVTIGILPWFANFRLLAEMSTPFVNNRWFFDSVGIQRDTKKVVVNGVLMAITFFISRILAIPIYWLKVYSIYGTEPCLRLGHTWYVMLISCVILDVLNSIWFRKIFKGIKKVLIDYFNPKKPLADGKVA